MKQPFPFHPALFTLWIALNAAMWSRSAFSSSSYVRLLVVAVVIAALMLVSITAFRDIQRIGFALFLALVPALAYGYLSDGIDLVVGQVAPRAELPLAVSLASACLLVGVRRLRMPGGALDNLTRILNVVTAALVLVSLGMFARVSLRPSRPQAVVPAQPEGWVPGEAQLPDIYYIVLDGFARSDVLRDEYEHDNSTFIAALEQMGFYVARESRSNYVTTAFSIPSALNMRFIDEVAPTLTAGSKELQVLSDLTGQSAVRQFLEGVGYTFMPLATGVTFTDIRDADHYLPLRTPGLTVPEARLVDLSMLRLVGQMSQRVGHAIREWGYVEHRSLVLQALETLPEVPDLLPGRPKLVFAHIISPHPPFVLDDEGKAITPAYSYNLADLQNNSLSAEVFRTGYVGQVAYLETVVPRVLSQILARSDVPPIVVLQSDHGPGRAAGEQFTKEFLSRRTPILNAYLLPGGNEAVHPYITPVNTFRVILDRYFGTQLGLLEDRSFDTPSSDVR